MKQDVHQVTAIRALATAPGYSIALAGDRRLAFTTPETAVPGHGWIQIGISGPRGHHHILADPVCTKAAALLGPEPVGEDILLDTVGHNHPRDAAALGQMLTLLARAGALKRIVSRSGERFAEVEPQGEHYCFAFGTAPGADDLLRLGRFSLMRPEDGHLVLESPLSHARVKLLEPALAALVAGLSNARPLSYLKTHCGEIREEDIAAILSLLIAEGMVTVCGQDRAGSDTSFALDHWEFHDLLFHSRGRRGRNGNAVGASFRFRGKVAPAPGVKPPMTAQQILLPRPNLRFLFLHDVPLTAALELRASIRKPTRHPISAAELGEFLYRTARVRDRSSCQGVEFTTRPYPSGGASYELEIYPVIGRCAGLLAGVYHYDPLAHALEPLSASNPATERLLDDACTANAGIVRPDVLLVITARFRRVSWKYESIAYATILKNVGAVYQTMYLVATAMKLAPCALGAGDSDLFSSLLGNDYYEEGAVGEFMLGTQTAEWTGP